MVGDVEREQMASRYETGIDLENRNSSHTLIVELVGYEKRVLDVGTSTGYLAEVLSGRGCRVTGIEIDPEAARRAEEHCERVVVGDIEALDVRKELGAECFDVIVFGDVLEHLRDPLRTLERLKPLIRPDGYVIASIPNVAHGSVRLALLQGRFRYQPVGLLDDTHLRFFTRESVEQLFSDAGFEIGTLERTCLDVFDTEIEIDRERIPGEVLDLVQEDPESLTYQFVLTARPSGEARSPGRISLFSERQGITSELEKLRRQLDHRDEQLAERDRVIHNLNRRLRNLDMLQYLLDNRTEELAKKEQEVSELAEEVARRIRQLTQRSHPKNA